MPRFFSTRELVIREISRTTILDRHEHVKIDGFAHVSHIDGTCTRTLLDCLYFPDQERRYEFVISRSLRRCFDGFVVWMLGCPLWNLIFHQKRRCHACTGGTWCLLRWCGPTCVLFDQIDVSKPSFWSSMWTVGPPQWCTTTPAFFVRSMENTDLPLTMCVVHGRGASRRRI